MDITIIDERGLPRVCETEGCGQPATSVWYGAWHGRPEVTCAAHSAISYPPPPVPAAQP